MKLNLPPTITSAQDLAATVSELHQYVSWQAGRSIARRVGKIQVAAPPAISPATQELMRSYSLGATSSRQECDELIATLKRYRLSAPTLTITLAAPPTNRVKSALTTWCRENIAANMLVNFEFNGTLLGGMVVRSKSHIFDWSFRRQILAGRAHFPEVLRRV